MATEVDQDTASTGWANPVEAVYQSVGRASVCWEDGKVPHGVFDEEQAIKIAEDLIAYLREHPL